MHLNGNLEATVEGENSANTNYHLTSYVVNASDFVVTGSASYNGAYSSYDGTTGTPIGQLGTFQYDAAFTSGQPFYLHGELGLAGSAVVGFAGGTARSHAVATLNFGNFDIVDENNQPVSFTAQGEMGSARGDVLPQGGSFGGITLTNSAPGRLGSTVQLLGGTASSPTTIKTTFVAPPTAPESQPACGAFGDVPSANPFYHFIKCVACRGIMTGYDDNTFRPNNLVTRAQMARGIAREMGYADAVTTQTFADVAPGNPFYEDIERLAVRGIALGYPCGSSGEPCDPDNHPYFRPLANTTRGELAKYVTLAAGYNESVTGQTFEDLPPAHPFYTAAERAVLHHIMSGYACGGGAETYEPCVGPGARPYFRPNAAITRGQFAKVLASLRGDCGIQLASDAVDVSGTGSDVVVVQLSYDPILAQSLFDDEGKLRLVSLDEQTGAWVNAVIKNLGGMPQFFPRAYNAATDLHLGYFGLDKANHVVWAVINHNSKFGVSSISPGEQIVSFNRPTAGRFHLDCFGEPGAVNRIETSTTPAPNSFTTLASVPADDSGHFEYTDTNAGTRKFYRVAFP